MCLTLLCPDRKKWQDDHFILLRKEGMLGVNVSEWLKKQEGKHLMVDEFASKNNWMTFFPSTQCNLVVI